MSNLDLWDKVRTPDPKFTKTFNRGGGFKGTATNTQYLVRLATEQFGPNGTGWGVAITDEKFVEGHTISEAGDKTIIHIVRGYVWYMAEGEKHQTSEQFGQTTFVGANKYGVFTDEEAPKKSVTDMMLKCLSLLGFSADVFMGLWDDNKYVNDARKKFETPSQKKEQPEKPDSPALPKDTGNPERNYTALEAALVMFDSVEQLNKFITQHKDQFPKLLNDELMDDFIKAVQDRRKELENG